MLIYAKQHRFHAGYVTSTERSEAILSALFERSDFLKAREEFWPKMEVSENERTC